MAGSYNHATTRRGRLRDNESFVQMVENLGDAYETVEEMYGMIWFLAERLPDPVAAVEEARRNYQAGLDAARRLT
jgi:hypothetical protein